MLKPLFILLLFFTSVYGQQQKNIIYLSWNDVVGKSLDQNLTLKSRVLDAEIQDYEVLRSWSNFLPSLRYQGIAVNNLELPVLVFMGQRFTLGTKYNVQHSLDLTLPLFTGGSRFFNISAQNYISKSLAEELKGVEQETVLNALQAYYGIILSNELMQSAGDAVEFAKQNLSQVEIFHREGSATELDLQRAKAQYYSVLPQFESAQSNRLLSYQQLKMILNLSLDDSVVVMDSLKAADFLSEYSESELSDFKKISAENRPELKAMNFRVEAAEEGEKLSLSQFAPVIALTGTLQHQAFKENANISWSDYTRSKAITLSVTWPLFEGGRRIIDYQVAKIRTEQLEIASRQSETGVFLEVEQNYYRFRETVKTLKSLEESMKQSKESLRLSNLLYSEGMSTQLEVLNAQLLYNSSQVQYLQGIYNYNINQLSLLKSVGRLNTIWD